MRNYLERIRWKIFLKILEKYILPITSNFGSRVGNAVSDVPEKAGHVTLEQNRHPFREIVDEAERIAEKVDRPEDYAGLPL